MDNIHKARFWAKVNKTSFCWEWTAYTDKNGYGSMRLNGVFKGAHRISFMIHYPDINIDSLSICHRCDNPKCIRPDHLFAGTRADNMYDHNAKGRANKRNQKISDKMVKEIRKIFPVASITKAEMARIYGIPENTFYDILNRRSFPDL